VYNLLIRRRAFEDRKRFDEPGRAQGKEARAARETRRSRETGKRGWGGKGGKKVGEGISRKSGS
jgi:hypothetical protein